MNNDPEKQTNRPNQVSQFDPSAPLLQADLNAELVQRLLLASRSRRRSMWQWRRFLPVTIVAVAIVLTLTAGPDATVLHRFAPAILILGVVAASWRLSLRARRRHTLHNQAMVAVQTHQWPKALAALSKLLSSPIDSPALRTTALLALAEVGSQARRHDEVVAILQEVLEGPTAEPYRQIALVEKALALLRAQRLTDATGLMESFRTIEFAEPMATLAEVAGLYRHIRTRNFTAAAEQADALGRRAREVLHRRAAGTYALIALALEQVGQKNRAQAYYQCATCLTNPGKLAWDFPETAGLAERLPVARSPL